MHAGRLCYSTIAAPDEGGQHQRAAEEEAPAAVALPLQQEEERPSWLPPGRRSLALLLVGSFACLAAVLGTQARPGAFLSSSGAQHLEQKVDCSVGDESLKAFWNSENIGQPVQVKVLSYNLFWWNLFGIRHGAGGIAGQLIARTGSDLPYDLMGFQECEDINLVLRQAGLASQYSAMQGERAVCIAFRTAAWNLVEAGYQFVAEDQPGLYGSRGAQWVRLTHAVTGKPLFFMNHHGPLPVNTGGICGGKAVAATLAQVIRDHAVPGDAIVFVGDFNANPASETIQGLSSVLTHVFNGAMCGGIDNVFSNVGVESVVSTANLGPGGSDHDAISAVIEVGLGAPMTTSAPPTTPPPEPTPPPATPPPESTPPPEPTTPAPEFPCRCHCHWATTKGACSGKSRDDSCCWQVCCSELKELKGGKLEEDDDAEVSEAPPAPEAPAAPEEEKEGEEDCDCGWASEAGACSGKGDGSHCRQVCCKEAVIDV